MKNPLPQELPAERLGGDSDKRHWFRLTGLPGWKRAQLGLPAFGKADCHPRPGTAGVVPKRRWTRQIQERKA